MTHSFICGMSFIIKTIINVAKDPKETIDLMPSAHGPIFCLRVSDCKSVCVR